MLRVPLAIALACALLLSEQALAARRRSVPVADAGSDQTVVDLDEDGTETVTLDGSSSFARLGSLVSWSWAEQSSPLGTGETLELPLTLGRHLVTLSVEDDEARTSSDNVRVYVDPPACQAEVLEPLTLYHIGHSLTDRIPELLSYATEEWTQQVEELPFAYKSIPGSPLFWHTDHPLDGLKGNIRTGNALEVLQSGVFDALLMTEASALEAFVGDPDRGTEMNANFWVDEFLAATTRPDPNVFIYSSWGHRNEDGPDTPATIATWLAEIGGRQALWEVVAQAVQDAHPGLPVHIVPVGLVLQRLQEEVLAGTLTLPGGLTFRQTFFKENRPGRGGGCGTPDWIHMSQTGIYVAALTHYAVVYGSCPIGLPVSIPYPGYEDGCLTAESIDVDPGLAQHIQETVWNVVKTYSWAGMP